MIGVPLLGREHVAERWPRLDGPRTANLGGAVALMPEQGWASVVEGREQETRPEADLASDLAPAGAR